MYLVDFQFLLWAVTIENWLLSQKNKTICQISENWLGFANICIHFAHQTYKIHQVLPYSVDFKDLGELLESIE